MSYLGFTYIKRKRKPVVKKKRNLRRQIKEPYKFGPKPMVGFISQASGGANRGGVYAAVVGESLESRLNKVLGL